MLVTSSRRQLRLAIEDAQRVDEMLARERAGELSRRALLVGGAAVGAVSLIPTASANPLLGPLVSIGVRRFLVRAAAHILVEGATFVTTWWLGKKLDEWYETARHYDADDGTDGRSPTLVWSGTRFDPAGTTTTTHPDNRSKYSKLTFTDQVKTRGLVTEVIDLRSDVIMRDPSVELVGSPGMGAELVVMPEGGVAEANARCSWDRDATPVAVRKGTIVTYYGRRSNWVQVYHPNWEAVGVSATNEDISGSGWRWISAEHLTSLFDGRRLRRYNTGVEHSDDYFTGCATGRDYECSE